MADIILNCIDLGTLRHKGIQAVSDTFGLLLRYETVLLKQLLRLKSILDLKKWLIEFIKIYFISIRYPIVTYCHDSPKLCVGTKTGVLALYDLKSPKYQVRGL